MKMVIIGGSSPKSPLLQSSSLVASCEDIKQILLEAKSRWLRPSEICEILHNYRRFNITPDPPYMPTSGSLFLFDRKALRYFRKDGHQWKKKKDGKTVREAHEKLKAGNVDVLHCYYAHREDDDNFQRRSYWLLDGQLEHIVLVHYRDLSEEASSSISQSVRADPKVQTDETSSSIPQSVSTDQIVQTAEASSGIHQSVSADPTVQTAETSSVAGSAAINSSTFVNPASYASSTSNVDWTMQTESSEFEDADSGNDLGGVPLAESIPGSEYQVASLPGNSITEPISARTGSIFHPHTASSMNTEFSSESMNFYFSNQVTSLNLILSEGQIVQGTSHAAGSFGDNYPSTWSEEHNFSLQQYIDPLSTRTGDSIKQYEGINFRFHDDFSVLTESDSEPFDVDDYFIQVEEENAAVADNPVDEDSVEEENAAVADNPVDKDSVEEENAAVADYPVDKNSVTYDSIQTYKMSHECQLDLAPPSDSIECAEEVSTVLLKNPLGMDISDNEPGDLEKNDSFEKWMIKELGNDCIDTFMASDSFSYWNTIDAQNDDVFTSMSRLIQFDDNLVAPSLSPEQLFSIDDFSPDWAYSGAETKVLISGVFLGGIQPSSIKWCCMFGEVEVSAEVLTTNAIRCQAPPHSPGRVPFYVTCSNRLACSEVREFEYRENPPGAAISKSLKTESEDEMYLQIRFANMLSLGSDKKRLLCSIENCSKCSLKKILSHMLIDEEPGWQKIEEETRTCQGHIWTLKGALLEKLLKGRLYEWLVFKLHEDGKGPNILDDKGQGVIHLAAALGYEWAMASIIAAGVNPSFRDVRGRTALHWAAYYGREQTVVTLLNLGASPGAIEDPTSKFPVGKTAADLASSSGHKGIAAYLAEADLTSHLSSMSLAENVMSSSTSLAAEGAVETVDVQNIISSDVESGQISLRESLAAVRNSAQAAALIFTAFRSQSFCQRQFTRNAKKSDIACEVTLPHLNSKIHKIGNFNEYLQTSAIKIQRKYRGWKSRKEFLNIRDRIVKIQAHVRGHQVRKQHKNVLWSVGIVEKAILRWRRKGSGLRGFRAKKAAGGAEQEVEVDEYNFLRVGRKQKEAGIEKALARVKSMVRCPEAREQYMRLKESSSKT